MHIRKRPQPSAQKQRRRHAAYHNHVRVFTQEIKRPAKSAELRHVPRNQLRFRFRQIKWRAIRLRNRRHQVHKKRHRRQKDEPHALFALRLHNPANLQRPRQQQRRHNGHPRRRLVAHQLRRAPQRTDDRIAAVGGPAAQHNPKQPDRTDPHHKQNPNIDIPRHLERRPKRQRRHRKHRCRYRDHRRHPEDELVRHLRNDVFLDQQLYCVRYRLQQSVRAHAHRPQPRLHVRHQLAFHQHNVTRHQRNQRDNDKTGQYLHPPRLEKRQQRLCRRIHVLTIHLAQDDIQRPNHRHHVRHQMPAHHLVQRLQINK